MSLFNLEESEKLQSLLHGVVRGEPQATEEYNALLHELKSQGKIQSIEAFVASQEADLAILSQHLQDLQYKVQHLQTHWRELLYSERQLPDKALLSEVYPVLDKFLK